MLQTKAELIKIYSKLHRISGTKSILGKGMHVFTRIKQHPISRLGGDCGRPRANGVLLGQVLWQIVKVLKFDSITESKDTLSAAIEIRNMCIGDRTTLYCLA